jgi:hypothetical protein
MTFKPGVKIGGIEPETVLAIMVMDDIYKSFGMHLVITSVTNGKHMKDSLHYKGYAFDCRTNNVSVPTQNLILAEAKKILDGEFDVLNEGDHIHIEYDPKKVPVIT